MSDKMRKEFEAYMNAPHYNLSKDGAGNYVNIPMHYTWLGFQAAYKASRHDELVELATVGYFALCDAVANSKGVPVYLIKKRDKAQELLKSMEK